MHYENPLALAENIASINLISEGRGAARRELGITGDRHRRAGRLRNGHAARRDPGRSAGPPTLRWSRSSRGWTSSAMAAGYWATRRRSRVRRSRVHRSTSPNGWRRTPTSAVRAAQPARGRLHHPPVREPGGPGPRPGLDMTHRAWDSTDPAEPQAQYEIRQGRKYRQPEPHQLSGTYLLSRRRTCSFPKR